MGSGVAVSRLKKELKLVQKDPPPHVTPRPLPSCILKWYFVIEGPKGTPYEGGLYMGKLVFPEGYPFKPPAVYMCTPNGRFKTNVKLCLSMSDFHPETWNPFWSVSAVLMGLLSFMLGSEETVGSIKTSDAEKIKFANMSHEFNQKDKVFRELFPDFIRYPSKERTEREPASAPKRRTTQAEKAAVQKKRHHDSVFSLLGWILLLLILCGCAWKLFAELGAS